MAAMIAGARCLTPTTCAFVNAVTASPLGHDGGSLDAACWRLKAPIHNWFHDMAALLNTGPATLAGTLVVGNAEVITGTALLQLAYPGAPVFYAAATNRFRPA